MSKRSVYTQVTPLPSTVTRQTVMETLYNHVEMIDLNPLVEERHATKPPRHSSPEEYNCIWYEIRDKIHYLPGGIVSGSVTYYASFHDLPDGIQTHCYAPLGVDIRARWRLGGSLPGEPAEAAELGIGAPLQGLYLREDVDLRCNIFLTTFVKKTLKRAHDTLKARIMSKTQLVEAIAYNDRLAIQRSATEHSLSQPIPTSPGLPSPNASGSDRASNRDSRGSYAPPAGMHPSRVSYQDLLRSSPKTSPSFPPSDLHHPLHSPTTPTYPDSLYPHGAVEVPATPMQPKTRLSAGQVGTLPTIQQPPAELEG